VKLEFMSKLQHHLPTSRKLLKNKRLILLYLLLFLLLLALPVTIVISQRKQQPRQYAAGTTSPIYGNILWKGDFETGNFSQYGSGGLEENGLPSVVTNPVAQDNYAAKFEIYPNSTTGSHSRAEKGISQALTDGYVGHTDYFTVMFYFPSNPDAQPSSWAPDSFSNQWNDLFQWMDLEHNCTPPLSVGISTPDWGPVYKSTTRYIGVYNEPTDNSNGCLREQPAQAWWSAAPMQYDHWYTAALLIHFDTSPTAGYVQVWLDGQVMLPKTHMQTVDVDGGNPSGDYFEIHNYQGSPNADNIVYFDNVIRHDNYNPDGASLTPTMEQ
jgi:Polysaccharide lyase